MATALKEMDREDMVFYANGISNSTIQSVGVWNFEAKELTDYC